MTKPSSFARFLNALLPWVFVVSAISVLLPICVKPSQAFAAFFSTGTFGALYHYKPILFVLYMGLLLIANRKMPKWSYTIAFLLVGIYACLLIFLAPLTYSVGYADSKGLVSVVTYTTTRKEVASYYLQYLFWIVFAYSVLFIVPLTGQQKRFSLILPISFVVIALVVCFYSYVADREGYAYIIKSGFTWKSVSGTSSFFNSKNEFGTTLFVGCASSLVLLSQRNGWRKLVWFLMAIYFFLQSAFIRTDTAALSMAAMMGCWYLALSIAYIKKKPVLCISFLALFVILIILIAIAVFIPDIYSKSPILNAAHSALTNYTLTTRTSIWSTYFSQLSASRFLIGDGQIGLFFYYMVVEGRIEELSFHNAYFDLYNAGGVAFLIFYLWTIARCLKGIRSLTGDRLPLKAALIAIAFGFLVYGVAENFVLFSGRYYLSVAVSAFLGVLPVLTGDGKETAGSAI